MTSLNLSSNALTGGLPAQLPFRLKRLDMSNNKDITGSVPDCVPSAEQACYNQLDMLSLRGTAASDPKRLFPSFVQLNIHAFVKAQTYSCPSLMGTSSTQIYDIPQSYTSYRFCLCNPGFSGYSGNCTMCQAGTFSKFPPYDKITAASPPAPSTCDPCPDGTFSTKLGSTSCSVAPEGEFVAKKGAMTSLICPNDAVCRAGSVTAKEGFWTGVNSDGTVTMHPCAKNRCDHGGCGPGRLGGPLPRLESGFDPTFLSKNYSANVLCGACMPGLIEVMGTCMSPCKNTEFFIFCVWVLTLILAAFIVRIGFSPQYAMYCTLKIAAW